MELEKGKFQALVYLKWIIEFKNKSLKDIDLEIRLWFLHLSSMSLKFSVPKHTLFKVLYFILAKCKNYTLFILFSVRYFKNTLF